MYILIYIIAAVLSILIYSCWENTYIEGVKDGLAETATKGIWGFIMPPLMKLRLFQKFKKLTSNNENYVLHYEIHLKFFKKLRRNDDYYIIQITWRKVIRIQNSEGYFYPFDVKCYGCGG